MDFALLRGVAVHHRSGRCHEGADDRLPGRERSLGSIFAEIDRLAGEQNTAGQDNFWRQEFLRLNALAGSMKGG
jgi:hypothetical protein